MSENHLEEFFELSLDMLCIAGEDYFFKRVNPSFQRILGWTPEELMSQPFTELIHPDDLSATTQKHEDACNGQPVKYFENRYRCKDGTYRHLMWTSFPDMETGLLYAVARDITEQKLSNEKIALLTTKLEKLAATDPLTGLFNRRTFDEQFVAQINLMNRMNKSLSILMIDIDNFKRFNDMYGHLSGDTALRKISTLISKNLRSTDIVTRYGGEEFAIILPDTSKETAIQQAERLCNTIYDYSEQNKNKLTISIGASSMLFKKTATLDISEIKLRSTSEADKALYSSKENGKNQINHYFDTVNANPRKVIAGNV